MKARKVWSGVAGKEDVRIVLVDDEDGEGPCLCYEFQETDSLGATQWIKADLDLTYVGEQIVWALLAELKLVTQEEKEKA